MATPPALTQIAFAGGLDESQEHEIQDPMGSFPVLQNARQDHRGGLSKRLGFGALSTTRLDGTSRSSGRRQFQHGKALAVIDSDGKLDTLAPTASARPNIPRGRVPEASVRLRELPVAGPYGTGDDVVHVNGYTVAEITTFTAGITPGVDDMCLVVIDDETGAIVRGPEVIATSVADIGLATYGVYAIAFSCHSGSSQIVAKYLDTTSAATINTGWQTLATFTDYNEGFDAVSVTSNDRVAIAYGADSNATQRITVKTLNIAGQIETVNVDTASGVGGGLNVALSENSDTLWLVFYLSTTLRVIGLDPTNIDGTPLASVLTWHTWTGSTVSKVAVCARAGSGKCMAYAVGDSLFTVARPITTSGGAAATDGAVVSAYAYLVSRPVLYNSRIYAFFTSATVTYVSDRAITLCDATMDTTVPYLRPVAAPVERGLYEINPSLGRNARIALVETGRYVSPFSLRRPGGSVGATLAELNFLDSNRWRQASLNDTTYLSGGVLTEFDGVRAFEVGFLTEPANGGGAYVAGALTFVNGRRYVVTFEHIDADGRRHLSGVSAPSPITGAGASKQVTLQVYPLSITARGDTSSLSNGSVRAIFWGTLDANNGQPPYYRAASVENDPTSLALLTATDASTDAVLATRELLYGNGNLPGTVTEGTQGAAQDKRSPCGWNHLVSYNGMLVGAQGSRIFWTPQNLDGEGVWTNPIFSTDIDDECTGLVVQDGAVYAFTRNRIFVAAGEPSNDTGTAGGMGAFRRLADTGGCVNPSSLVSTPQGIVFESERGIERLSRGGAGEFLGQAIERTFASYPIVSSAVYDERHGVVRISLATGEASGGVTGTGRTVVYDPNINAWQSVDIYPSNEAVQDAGMVYVDGAWRYGWLGTDGEIHYEKLETDATAYLDGTSTWITLTAETGYFKASGLQGRQHVNRVLVLERKSTQHDLALSLAYNYETSYRAARTWTKTEIDALLTAGWPITQLKHDPHDDAECQSVRIKLVDATPTAGTVGTGKGATWLGLTLDITPRPGAFEVPEEAA